MMDNSQAVWTNVAQYAIPFFSETDEMDAVELAAGQVIKGSATDPVAAYPRALFDFDIDKAISPASGVQTANVSTIESTDGGTRKPIFRQIAYDDSVEEGVIWYGPLRVDVSTAKLRVTYRMAQANTSKNVAWRAWVAAMGVGDTSVNAKAFGSYNEAIDEVPSAADVIASVDVTLTNFDSGELNDILIIMLTRNIGTASNAAGDAEILDVELLSE